ncbi:MAG: hypothetical protein ACE5F9_07695, partial [Phycisphaerae bacterium]
LSPIIRPYYPTDGRKKSKSAPGLPHEPAGGPPRSPPLGLAIGGTMLCASAGRVAASSPNAIAAARLSLRLIVVTSCLPASRPHPAGRLASIPTGLRQRAAALAGKPPVAPG